MYDKFIGRDLDNDGDTDFIATEAIAIHDGVFWLEQVRSSTPQAFERAREVDSPEMPLFSYEN